MTTYAATYTRCSVCHETFTTDEWANRHSDEDGEDCHERCCPICKADEQDDEYMVACPRCGAEQEDFDGFGVLHCEACGYCVHPSGTVDDNGNVTCGICGQVSTTERIDA